MSSVASDNSCSSVFVFAELGTIDSYADIQDWVELVSVLPVQIEPYELFDFRLVVDLEAVEIRLEIVQLIRIGFPAQNSCPIEWLERFLDHLCLVQEVEHEDIVFLRVGSIEP